MEVRILHKFHDRADFTKVYLVGETVTFDDARAESLVKRGLVEFVEAVEDEVELVEENGEASEEVIEAVEEPIEASEKPVEAVVAEPIEEAVVKPVATKRRSASKDN